MGVLSYANSLMNRCGIKGIVLIDSRADGLHPPFPNLRQDMEKAGWRPIMVPAAANLPAAIASHPDIQVCALDAASAIVSPELAGSVLQAMREAGVRVQLGVYPPSSAYPGDCIYNAVVSSNYFISGIRCANPVLETEMQIRKLKPICVRQGYVRCSLLPLPDDCFITADRGIAQTLNDNGLEHHLIAVDLDIYLPGYVHGFLGGCGGCAPDGTVFLSGNPVASGDISGSIESFVSSKKHEFRVLSGEKLYDVGSLIFFMWGE